MTSPETLLRAAVDLAAQARAAGNHPFGALLADDAGQIRLTAQNTVVTGSDVTGHAETNLVRAASATYPPGELARLTLFTSTEPCAMCAGAIYWSGIGAVVYALASAGLEEFTDPAEPALRLTCRAVFAAGSRPVRVEGPFPLPEAAEVHAGFWR
jgi:tRNA(Arg) A34 adenosine deaminase TadA